MKKLVWVSDYFIDEIPTGGAELCDAATIEFLSKEFSIEKVKCISLKEVSRDSSYVFSNIAQLNPEIIKKLIEQEIEYRIYLHDHSYCVYRNPFRHNKLLKCDCFNHNSLVHMFFFFAKRVFCQTLFHKDVVDQNVYCNTLNVGSNLWSMNEIEHLKLCKEKATSNGKYIIFQSQYAHKNTRGAIEYAEKNSLQYELVSGLEWKKYIEKLSKSEGIIFFPILAESASRLAFEAKALGKKVITNKLVGYTWEPWWKENMIDFEKIIEEAQDRVVREFRSFIEHVSIFCTTYNSEKHIVNFLENMLRFKGPIFNVVVYDGGSTDNTVKIIKDFLNIHDIPTIIQFYQNKNKIGIYEGWNRAISKCKAPVVINMNADDRFSNDALDKLYFFMRDEKVDFVYADSYVTKNANETFENHTKSGELKWPEYDKELLKKMCFGGHYPLWRKKLLFKVGLFDESFKSAGDWNQWLKFSEAGAKFKKLNEVLGLYYFNPDGASTIATGASRQNIIESNMIREKYSNIV